MKKILFALAIAVGLAYGFWTPPILAQCNGVFPNNTLCGNVSGTPAPPAAIATTSVITAQSTNWINVKNAPYNATGNGTSDDTAAINSAIAAFNTAGAGVLYFPAGTYKTTTSLTTVTANGVIKGDGQTNLSNQLFGTTSGISSPALPATVINQTSTTAPEFTVTSQALIFQDLAIQNTSGGTPTTGSVGILVNTGIQLTATGNTGTNSPTLTFASVPGTVVNGMSVYDVTTGKNIGNVQSVASPNVTLALNAANAVTTNDVINFGGLMYQKVDYQGVQVSGFNIGIDIKTGALWSMHNTNITGSVLYGIRINNVVNSDAGDWTISNSSVFTISSGGAYSGGTSAIRIEGSGGGKIVNSKINEGNGVPGWTNGIDVVGNGGTVDLLIANCSIEGTAGGSAININGLWPFIVITNSEIGFGTPAHAVNAVNTSNVIVSGTVLQGSYSGTAVNFSNCTNCYYDAIQTGNQFLIDGGSTVNGNVSYFIDTIGLWFGPTGTANVGFPFSFFNINGVQVSSNSGFLFVPNVNAENTPDSGITRAGPKVVNFNDGVGVNANGWFNFAGEVRVSADAFVPTSSFTNVTGLAVSLTTGRSYSFETYLTSTDAPNGGIQVALSGTNGLTASPIIYDGWTMDSNVTRGQGNATSLGVAVGGTTTTSSGGIVTLIRGLITVGVGGILNIQAAQKVNSATATTIKQGSHMIVHDMP